MRAALLPLALQIKLLNHKIPTDDFELDAPQDVSTDVVMLRKALDTATMAFFRCEAGSDTSTASLQSKLASFLHADRSKRDETHSTEDGIYGANLAVHIQPAAGMPNSLFVVLTFDIECGDDNLLFLYTRDSGQWVQRLHWYSDKYTKPSDAFGDIFLYSIVPGLSGIPIVAVAHGHPWCTSRWSGFELDLLRPASETVLQGQIGHFAAGYDRASDSTAHITPTADGFTFKFWTNEAMPPKDPTQMSGPLTLRFKTSTGGLHCVSKRCKSS